MAKCNAECNDCWCEHYDKHKKNCDKCVKNEEPEDKSELSIILQRRAIKQMETNEKIKTNGQNRR